MNRYIRRKRLTPLQARVMKIVRAGGCVRLMPYDPPTGRVLNARYQPVMNIQERTFDALRRSERIRFDKEMLSWVNNPKRLINPDYHG